MKSFGPFHQVYTSRPLAKPLPGTTTVQSYNSNCHSVLEACQALSRRENAKKVCILTFKLHWNALFKTKLSHYNGMKFPTEKSISLEYS